MDDPRWYAAQTAADPSDAAYLADVEQAWAVAEAVDTEAAAQGRQVPLLGREIRCALVTASLHSLAQNIPPALLLALVRKGRWSPSLGLAAARHNPYQRAKAEALGGLALRLAEGERDAVLVEALAAARAVGDERARVEALRCLSPSLPDAERLAALMEALAAARSIKDGGLRAEALEGLAPRLPATLLSEALAVARSIEEEWAKARALGALASQLTGLDRKRVLAEARSIAHAVEVDWQRARALGELAPRFAEGAREDVLAEALEATRKIDDESRRAEALAALAPYLAEGERASTLAKAIDVCRNIRSGWRRERALAALGPCLPADLLIQALGIAWDIKDKWTRVQALGALAPHLPEAELATVLEAIREIGALGDEVFKWRAEALAAVAPRLSGETRDAVLAEALASASAIDDEAYRAQALEALAPCLPEALLSQALSIVRGFDGESWRFEALEALAPRLPVALLSEALSAVPAIGDVRERVWALGELALSLPEDRRAQALAEALRLLPTIGDEAEQARVLEDLARLLFPSTTLHRQALAIAHAIQDAGAQMKALKALEVTARRPPWMASRSSTATMAIPEGERVAALTAIRAIGDVRERVEALRELVPRLVGTEQLPALYHVWAETLHALSTKTRPDVLSHLLRLLPIIALLGGVTATLETVEALRMVGQRWP